MHTVWACHLGSWNTADNETINTLSPQFIASLQGLIGILINISHKI